MIRHLLAILLLWNVGLYADDYSFDMESIETKSFEYSGYLRSEYKYQNLNLDSPLYTLLNRDDSSQNTFLNEALFRFTHYKDDFKLIGAFSARYNNIDGVDEDIYTIYQLYTHNTLSVNHSIGVGKQTLKWGTGYFFNPAAFLDRPKDPTQPENAYEGYVMANYTYNKSFDGELKNLKLDLLYMPTTSQVNDDFYDASSSNLAMKLYLLYLDTDISFIYLYSDEQKDKIGFTFSRNLATYFEVHGEYAKEIDGYYAYLLGLKYVTQSDITITSEYYYDSDGLTKEEIRSSIKLLPFPAKSYFVNKFSKKEPLGIVYSSVYFKDILNTEDSSHLDTLGFIYTFKNNLEIDFSYNLNTGNKESEFGKKMVSDFAWLKATWYF
ncbi:MAG: hypothetical protein HKP62_08380 [Sulfurovum sp.]|nr:hypothetical protein [Sulfurovum sp.]NNJ46016.1 hypothetical protein [Sulfurovum sp.]